jgi:hypothetical protein
VSDLVHFIPALAFGGGLVFGLTFDTSGPRLPREAVVEREAVERPVPVEDRVVDDRVAADEPMTAERTVATRDGDYATTTAPAPEAPPRTLPRD